MQSARLLFVGVLLLGGVVTALFVREVETADSEARAMRIESAIDARQVRIEEDLDRSGAMLAILAEWLLAEADVSHAEFSRVVAEILVQERAISAVGWCPRVAAEDRDAFVARAREISDPAYQLSAAVVAPEDRAATLPLDDAYAVLFLEPLERNRTWLGNDLAGAAERRRAIERAIEEMDLVATAPHALPRETALGDPDSPFAATDPHAAPRTHEAWLDPGGSEFLLFFPIFDDSARVGRPDQRHDACVGVVVGMVRTRGLLARSLGRALGEDFDLVIRDTTESRPRVIDVVSEVRDGERAIHADPVARRSFRWAGREWEIAYHPHPTMLAGSPTGWMIVVGAVVSLLAALLATILLRVGSLHLEKEVLRRDEERFRLVLGAISDGWWDWWIGRGELNLSPSWLRTFGRSPVHPAQGEACLARWVHPDDAEGRELALRRHLEGRTAEYSLELRIAHSDGDDRWVLERGSVVARDAAGNALRMVASIQEITAQKRMEEERAEMEERMRETQRFESLGLITSGVAHDFNNWLTTIGTNASYVRDALERGDSPEEALAEIDAAIGHAGGLTSQLLDYSGKSTARREGIDLCSLLSEMRDLLRTAVGKGVEFAFQAPEEHAWIEGDPNQIAQVVMNLVTNAADAMAGRGTVTIECAVVTIPEPLPTDSRLGVRLPAGRYAVLSVSDDGSGMDPEIVARIFDPFFTTKEKGRGLGLAGVQGIVRRHGGSIDVTSRPGQGSTFTLRLPYSRPEGETVAAPRTVARGSSTSQRVLVVDDEEGVRDSIARLLDAHGHAVDTAVHGEAAIEWLREHPGALDLVVLDMTMPGLDGVETFAELRRLDPTLRGVFISGYAEEKYGTLPDGLIGFFQKPFRTEEFLAVIGARGSDVLQ